MKKKVFGVFALLFLCMPMIVNAKTYDIDNNMSINLDESIWYVFTRDNIKNNKELDELNITYDYMNNLFNTNKMYLDATLFYNNGNSFIEIIVRKTENEKIKNLKNYSDADAKELGDELAKKTDSTDYDIYENDYKYVRSKYLDKKVNYYVIEYYTIINGYNYTITVQDPSEYTKEEEQAIKEIIDGIKYNVDASLKEPKNGINWNSVFSKALAGAITGGLIGLAYAIFNKKIKKDK